MTEVAQPQENSDDSLDRKLADLEANSAGANADADPAMRTLFSDLETLADALRPPQPVDEFAAESACQQAVEMAKRLSQETVERPLMRMLGQYECVELLGQGGMGAVYKAIHTRLEKIVALKILHPDRLSNSAAVARFEREMKAAGRLEHPNIVRATDAGSIDGVHYLAMEYIRGVDLSSLVNRCGPLPVAEACELIRQAAAGLQAAYLHGMVHRDIKPGNLMLAEPEHGPIVVKVLDLGLAQLADPTAEGPELTSAGQIMGTFDYMAPEQAGNTRGVDIRADIYALGATLYKLLTGKVIYHQVAGGTILEKLAALATQPITPIQQLRPNLPAALVTLIHTKLLARDPAQRFSTPAEVHAALAPFAQQANLQALWDHAQQQCQQETRESNSRTTHSNLSSQADSTNQWRINSPALSPAAGKRSRSFLWIGLLAAALAIPLVVAGVIFSLQTPHGQVVVELAADIPPEVAEQIKIEARGDGALQVADATRGWTIEVREGQYKLGMTGAGTDTLQLDQGQVVVSRNHKTLVRVSVKPSVKPTVAPTVNPSVETKEIDFLSLIDPAKHALDPGVRLENGVLFTPKWNNRNTRVILPLDKIPTEYNLRLVAERISNDRFGINPGIIMGGRQAQVAMDGGTIRSWCLAHIDGKSMHDGNVTRVVGERFPLGKKATAEIQVRTTGVKVLCDGQVVIDWQGRPEQLSLWDQIKLPNDNCLFLFSQAEFAISELKLIPLDPAPAPPTWEPTPEQQAFFAQVAKLPAAEQVEAVRKKLQEVNPGYDGMFEHQIENGHVIGLKIQTGYVTELWPVRALPGLRRLSCSPGLQEERSKLADLSPLAGTQLLELTISNTSVADLRPLQGMPLQKLNCNQTLILDFAPLAELKQLRELDCSQTAIVNLSPLAGKPLLRLNCQDTQVADLTPLKGMDLEELTLNRTRVFDLTPLANMPLTLLWMSETQVRNIAALRGMPLKTLGFNSTKVRDLTPLTGMKELEQLHMNMTQVNDLSALRGAPLQRLYFDGTGVADISVLRAMPLTSLGLGNTKVSDLSALRGMSLQQLVCHQTHVADISVLEGMPLQSLFSNATLVSDLRPLRKAPLQLFAYSFQLFENENLELARSLKLITKIDTFNSHGSGLPPETFFARQQARREAAEKLAAEIAQLPPEKQGSTILAKLREQEAKCEFEWVQRDGAIVEAKAILHARHDIIPLRGLTKLKKLTLVEGLEYLDLSPLNSLPLEEINCTPAQAIRNKLTFAAMPTLKIVNGQPVSELQK